MPSAASPDKANNLKKQEYAADYLHTRKLVFLAMLASIALALHILELALPNPTPWLRLGLANIITLTILSIYGLKEALTVGIIRIVLGSFISGNLFGPAFLLGFSGGILSIFTMWLALFIAGRYLSLIGISLIGAYTHTLTQLALASFILIGHTGIFFLLPVFMIMALLTGLLNGVGALILTNHLSKARM